MVYLYLSTKINRHKKYEVDEPINKQTKKPHFFLDKRFELELRDILVYLSI